MKKILALLAISTLLFACSNTEKATTEATEKTKEVEKTTTPNPDRDSRGYYLK